MFLPNGMVGSVYVASLRHNDNGVQNMSGLNDYLCRILSAFRFASGCLPCLYADGIFSTLPTIIPRFSLLAARNELERIYFKEINRAMSPLRNTVEHLFGHHANLFKLFERKHKFNMFSKRDETKKIVLMSYFVLNCYHCLRGNGDTMTTFNMAPMSLAEYLPLDEVLEPSPAVNLGEVYDFNYPNN